MQNVLVTGGTGFLGMQIIYQLLEQGYLVTTTVRLLGKEEQVIQILQRNGAKNLDNLTFKEADLSSDDHWEDVMAGQDYVLSVASPVFFEIPKDEATAIRPAVEGVQRVLKAAQKAQVKRVVMTSNFGAVGFSRKKGGSVQPTTEKDWTDPNEPGLSIYEKSKLLAEKAAWEIVRESGNTVEFSTINPVAIFGPSLSAHVSGSFDLLKNILNGSMKRIPNISLNVVDVRDVADLHIRAMVNPAAAGQRFIASADGKITFPEIVDLVKRKRPEVANKISTKSLPDKLVKIGSHFNQEAKEGRLLLDMNRNVSNQKAKELLDWKPITTNEEIVLAAVDTLVNYELI